MGLFDRRERELELQNKELEENIRLLETRLKNEKMNSEEMRDKISKLKGTILLKDTKLVEKDIELEEYAKQNELYESYLIKAKETFTKMKKKIADDESKIKKLEKENTRLNVKPKSNAGRKSKINDEVIKITKKLRSENKSLMQISKELEISTGVAYSKSTIKNIIDNYVKAISVHK